MNAKSTALYITQAAAIAALYFLLNLLQNALLPGTTSMAIQFRFAEALCVLALFTTAATVLATLLMYLLRNVKIRNYPWLSMLMPVVCNAVIVGWELTYYFDTPILLNMLYVAAGEAAVIFVLGTALYFVLERNRTRLFAK